MDRPKKASNVDRRSGIERREFLYAVHIPERRSISRGEIGLIKNMSLFNLSMF